MYIVISKPKRMSQAWGVVHCMMKSPVWGESAAAGQRHNRLDGLLRMHYGHGGLRRPRQKRSSGFMNFMRFQALPATIQSPP
jgi:hypothetical protein